jgi:hypothetical protein
MKEQFDFIKTDIDLDISLDGGNGFSFDLGDFGGEGTRTVETQYVKPPVYVGKRRVPKMYEHAQALTDDMGDAIMAGERVDCIVSGNFILGDFIEALAVTMDVLIKEMTISTLSMSPDNVASLKNLVEGDFLRKLDIIISDYWYWKEKRNVPFILEYLGENPKCPFRLAVAGSHTKITLIETEAGQKIVLHGSGNLRSSDCIEQLTVETCPVLYDFHYAWHKQICDTYEVKPKSLRHGNLWTTVNQAKK